MPQQRRAQVTRHAIVVAAAEEFDRVGYEASTLSAILRRSGVTKGAFYFHFPSKEALAATLIGIQSRSWSRLWRRWKCRDLDPLSMAVGLIDEAMGLLDHDIVVRAGVRLASQRLPADAGAHPDPRNWESLLGELFRRSADSGLLRSGVDPAVAARVVHAALVGVRTMGCDRRNGHGMANRVAEVWRVVLEGIASADWLRSNQRLRTLE